MLRSKFSCKVEDAALVGGTTDQRNEETPTFYVN